MKLLRLISKLYFVVLIGLLLLISSCKSNDSLQKFWIHHEAPAIFKARFETTKGNFEIEAHRAWSPKAVDRLYQLIKSDFYIDVAIFRVVPDYVAQFGIHDKAALNESWNSYKIDDETVIEKNVVGTLAFARGGKKTRTTQLFINLKNNSPRLDTLTYKGVQGFPVIAKIINGMDIVKEFYDGYAEEPGKKQDVIQKKGNTYLKEHFPKLDYIKKAYVIE